MALIDNINWKDISKSELTSAQEERLGKYLARQNRWHDKQIELLSFSIGLIFTLVLGLLGFIYSQKENEQLQFKGCKFIIYVSLACGIVGLVVRLLDFRFTFKITKYRKRIWQATHKLATIIITGETNETVLPKMRCHLQCLLCTTKYLGMITWTLFILQSLSFIYALISFIIIKEVY